MTLASLMSDEDLGVCFRLTFSELSSFIENLISSEVDYSNDA